MTPLLRLTQSTRGDVHTVHVAFEGGGHVRQTADVTFSFALTPHDESDLRWYLEDYLEWSQDPAPTITARIEARMQEIGTELFRAVFQADDDARDLWATLRGQLAKTRVEVVTGVHEATTIPWELLRDPKTKEALALRCRDFVRA